MSVDITSTSKHSRTRRGSKDAQGRPLGNTTLGHAQYTIASGKGSNRISQTFHCSEDEIHRIKKQLGGS